MAETVAPIISDAVTQANVKVLADAPAIAVGSLYQVLASSMALSIQNAVSAQQQLNMASQAATILGVSTLYAVDIATTAEPEEKIDMGDFVRLLIESQAATGGGR